MPNWNPLKEFGDAFQDRIIDPVRDSLTGKKAKEESIAAQQAATDAALAQQKEMYEQQRQDYQPYTDAGIEALGSLQAGDFMEGWEEDPGYKFRMEEGLKAVNARGSARGSSLGGATMKALSRYGQGLAAQEYGNVYNREYGRLSQLAGLGAGATGGMAGAAGAYGSNTANLYTNMGNAEAAANQAQANRESGLWSSLIGAGGMALGGMGGVAKPGMQQAVQKAGGTQYTNGLTRDRYNLGGNFDYSAEIPYVFGPGLNYTSNWGK